MAIKRVRTIIDKKRNRERIILSVLLLFLLFPFFSVSVTAGCRDIQIKEEVYSKVRAGNTEKEILAGIKNQDSLMPLRELRKMTQAARAGDYWQANNDYYHRIVNDKRFI